MRRLAFLLSLLILVTGCAENQNYKIKALVEKDGRHYVVCRNNFVEEYIEVDVTPEVYKLLKIDGQCPVPMSVPPTPSTTTSRENS